jgi:hypothetical protein
MRSERVRRACPGVERGALGMDSVVCASGAAAGTIVAGVGLSAASARGQRRMLNEGAAGAEGMGSTGWRMARCVAAAARSAIRPGRKRLKTGVAWSSGLVVPLTGGRLRAD